MIAPAVNDKQTSPNWDLLPKECIHLKYDCLTRRVVDVVFAILGGVGAVAAYTYRAELGFKVFSVLIKTAPLYISFGAFVTFLAICHFFETSIGKRQRQRTGAEIENGGNLLPFTTIEQKYKTHLKDKVLVDSDINLLVRKELASPISFVEFANKHTSAILLHLDSESKEILRQKYLEQDFTQTPSFKQLQELVWVQELEIPEKVFFEKFRQIPISDLDHFLLNMPNELKSYVYIDSSERILRSSISINNLDRHYKAYCIKWFGDSSYNTLKNRLWDQQFKKLCEGKVEDYEKFRADNHFEDIEKAALDSNVFAMELKKCFLKMLFEKQGKPEYDRSRIIFT